MRSRSVILCVALLPCTLLAARPAAAQHVSGHVMDDSTGLALADVAIRVFDEAGAERAVTYSDSTGWFSIRLQRGAYRFRLSRLGYVDLATDPVVVGRNEVVALELRLGPSAIPVEPVLVRGRRRTARIGAEEFHRRMAQQQAIGHGRFITRGDIESTSVAGVNELVTRDPSLMILPRTREGGQTTMSTIDVLVMRQAGRRHCYPAVFIDGVRILTEETDLSSFLQPERLEGVEIYPDPPFTPGELMDPRGCGSVAFWTRGSEPTRFISMRQLYIAAAFVAGALLLTR